GDDGSRGGVRQGYAAEGLPAGRAEGHGRFLERRRNGAEYVARDRGDERDDHDPKNDSGGQHADSDGRTAEQRTDQPLASEMIVEPGLDVRGHEGSKHEQS